jgi:hypothetical protein
MEKLQKYFIPAILVIVLLSFFKGCGTSTQIKTTEKQVELLTKKVDSLSTIVVSQDKLINIIKETPNWKTLEIEELSDKNHMPINHYKNELGQ